MKERIKLLLVEDGSINIDDLKENLKNSDIKIVVYRQGSTLPILMDLDEKHDLELNKKEK